MAEIHKAKIRRDNGEKPFAFDVVDEEPLASARLFKAVSDAIWSQKTRKDDWAQFGIPAEIEPEQALTSLNTVLKDIDEQFIRIGTNKSLQLGGLRGEKETFKPSDLQVPLYAGVQTYNWDQMQSYRVIRVDGKREVAEFTDGHTDYGRELAATFEFRPEGGGQLALSYLIQRYQYYQSETTDMHFHAWYSGFAETGYEGNSQFKKELTPQQEQKVLEVFVNIGGLAVDPKLLSGS